MVVSIGWWTEFSLKNGWKITKHSLKFVCFWYQVYTYLWEDSFQVICYIMCNQKFSMSILQNIPPPFCHVFLCRGCIVAEQIGSAGEASKLRLSRKKGPALLRNGAGKSFASACRFFRNATMRRTKRVFCKTSWNFLRRLRKIIRQFKKQKRGTWQAKNRDMTCLVTFGRVRLDDRIIAYVLIKRLGRQQHTQSEQPSKHYWFSATSSSWHLRQVLAGMGSPCKGATSILP